MLTLAVGLGGCSAFQDFTESGTVVAPIGHGPKVVFQNASTRPLEVRYWVGRRDPNKTPGGVDVMTPVAFQIDPGEQRMHDVGRTFWQTANTDAVVRVQVNLIDDDGNKVEGVDPWWFEFERPAPYSIRAVNASRTRRISISRPGAKASCSSLVRRSGSPATTGCIRTTAPASNGSRESDIRESREGISLWAAHRC
ncbi:MAG: hypothetical protein ACFHWZ_04805 [Phycisphaerales bacterium]